MVILYSEIVEANHIDSIFKVFRSLQGSEGSIHLIPKFLFLDHRDYFSFRIQTTTAGRIKLALNR